MAVVEKRILEAHEFKKPVILTEHKSSNEQAKKLKCRIVEFKKTTGRIIGPLGLYCTMT